jgi:hypothetical protein
MNDNEIIKKWKSVSWKLYPKELIAMLQEARADERARTIHRFSPLTEREIKRANNKIKEIFAKLDLIIDIRDNKFYQNVKQKYLKG